LTPRERQVAQLIVEGLTCAEIAQRLGIAPSTAARHIQQGAAKLDGHGKPRYRLLRHTLFERLVSEAER
jgi:DNA-binding CsgD family transcriptional regulator